MRRAFASVVWADENSDWYSNLAITLVCGKNQPVATHGEQEMEVKLREALLREARLREEREADRIEAERQGIKDKWRVCCSFLLLLCLLSCLAPIGNFHDAHLPAFLPCPHWKLSTLVLSAALQDIPPTTQSGGFSRWRHCAVPSHGRRHPQRPCHRDRPCVGLMCPPLLKRGVRLAGVVRGHCRSSRFILVSVC